MKENVKKRLEFRNKKIIQAIIKKADSVCPGSIALIGIAGSFCSGDIHEKSDLDLCIVSNDDDARKVELCFIVGDVAFDIYCTPWDKLEKMSEYSSPYVTKLLKLNIVYCSNLKYKRKYMKLRAKVIDKLKKQYSTEDNNNAGKYISEASVDYTNLMLSDKYSECKYLSGRLLINVEHSLYLFNKSYVKRGTKRIPEEIFAMKRLPNNFQNLYLDCIKSKTVNEIKATSSKLMKEVILFANQMKNRVVSKKKITKKDLVGTYEEIYSNWRNKMYYAAQNNDWYLSFMTSVSCQEFYNEMHSRHHIDRIDLFKNFSVNDLAYNAKAFDNALKKYRNNYEKLALKVKYYKDLDEFEAEYGRE